MLTWQTLLECVRKGNDDDAGLCVTHAYTYVRTSVRTHIEIGAVASLLHLQTLNLPKKPAPTPCVCTRTFYFILCQLPYLRAPYVAVWGFFGYVVIIVWYVQHTFGSQI